MWKTTIETDVLQHWLRTCAFSGHQANSSLPKHEPPTSQLYQTTNVFGKNAVSVGRCYLESFTLQGGKQISITHTIVMAIIHTSVVCHCNNQLFLFRFLVCGSMTIAVMLPTCQPPKNPTETQWSLHKLPSRAWTHSMLHNVTTCTINTRHLLKWGILTKMFLHIQKTDLKR